ncbi:MAG TPA: hypothetical protein DEP46_02850, partial [Blastocatellia bacterium]|nr:hypothetical protein [Blastocatellia bacterium]
KITPLDQIDRIVSGPDSTKLTDEIAQRAITLVRQEAGALPVNRDKKIAVFGVSNGFDGPSTMGPFAGTLRSAGLRFGQAYLQENSLAEQAAAARKTVMEADVVIVGLYGRVRSGAKNSVGIPENGAAILREALAAGKQVIGVSFGNPYILSSFPEMKTYIVAYGDMPSLQRASARALLGMQNVTGKLPISLPGLHPRGTGLGLNLPTAISLPKPPFPPAARAVRAFGDVLVDVRLDLDGKVISAEALTGHPLLRRNAENAAKIARFEMKSEGNSRNIVLIYRFLEKENAAKPCCDSFPFLISVVPENIWINTLRSNS